MANLKLHNTWNIGDLRRDEFLLILKALGGRLTGDEIAQAVKLGGKLTEQRVAAMRQLAADADRLNANLTD